MHLTRKIIILLIIQGTLANRATAQALYNFYHLGLDKGLSDARVNNIIQDRYGFMWFATPNGLNRYDGYSIKTYYAGINQSGLPSNQILGLFSTLKGELWIGTASGPVRFDFLQEKFIPVDTTQPEAAEMARAGVHTFTEDAQGNLYAGSTAGLFRYKQDNHRWENLSRKFHLQNRMRFIRGLKFFNDEMLYVTNNENLPFFRINIARNTVDSIHYKSAWGDTCCPIMFGMEKLTDSTLMVGFLSSGISILNVHTKQFSIVPGILGKSDSITYNSVYSILKDHEGSYWIASWYFGLVRYFPEENKVTVIENDPYHPYGINSINATCLYEDRQHNIWIGTANKGIFRFNPGHRAVRFYPQNKFMPPTLTTERISCITAVHENTWVIGSDKGPSLYNRKTQTFTNFRGISKTGINKPLEHVQCAIQDSTGIIWMGTNRLGLMRYDPQSQSIRCFSRVTWPHPLIDDGITDLWQMPDGNLLFIGWGRPNIFNTKSFYTTSFREDSNSALLRLNNIRDIGEDAQQHLWLVNTAGNLYEYDPYKKILKDQSGLLAGVPAPLTIYAMAWHQNALYFASSAGIIRTNRKKELKLFPLKPGNHLQQEVRGIQPLGDYVWFSNTKLIGRLHLATGKMIFLGEKDGFHNVQLFPQTIARSQQGTILIGSNKGFYEIFPGEIQEPAASTTHLTAFRVYDKPFYANEFISNAQEISLGSQQNFFSFDVSAFDFAQASDIEYAYKLEGFDNDWQYIGRERRGSYTNVPGGDYILKLKARNIAGEWNESGQQIRIHIAKPFTTTWGFRLLVTGLLLAAAYLFYRYRINRINAAARLRSDYEIKLNELENSALRTQMNPHFIFNSLNTINSFVNSNDRIQANRYISKFSRLVRLILDHSRQKKIALKDELEVAELYMQLEQIRFERCFQYTIDVQGVDTALAEVPPLIIQPFVENSILHGLLPLQREGQLKITISRDNNLLHIFIEDNGIGRQAAMVLKNQSGFKRRSHGMEITLKRIELFNKENGLMESVEIRDLKKENGEVAGTLVEIPLAYSESF